MYRYQKNITIPIEKLDDVYRNFGKIPNSQLAVLIGESYGKLINNLKVLGLIKVPEKQGFDIDSFSKHYKY